MSIKLKTNFLYIFTYAILTELILGGSGHLLEFGGVSIRHILLFCIIFIEFIISFKNGFYLTKSKKVLLLLIFYFLGEFMYGLLRSMPSNVYNEFSGYMPIISCLFFSTYFRIHDNINSLKRYIETLCMLLALLNLAMWLYCFITRDANFIIIHLMKPYNYGNLSLIGTIPRIFLKGSVFICIGFIFKFSDIISNGANFSGYIELFIYFLSVLVSFTVGLYIATFLATIALLVIHKQDNKTKYTAIISTIVIMTFIIIKYDITNIISDRFSGDYTPSFKLAQIKAILSSIDVDFLFGKGLGYAIQVDYGYVEAKTYSFEVMWGQLFLHLGVIGFCLFLYHIYLTLKNLYSKYKITNNRIFLLLLLSVSILCMESMTNPYMNNAIGLLFYAVCVGISEKVLNIYDFVPVYAK